MILSMVTDTLCGIAGACEIDIAYSLSPINSKTNDDFLRLLRVDRLSLLSITRLLSILIQMAEVSAMPHRSSVRLECVLL